MGIKRNLYNLATDMTSVKRSVVISKMQNSTQSHEHSQPMFDEAELYNSQTMASDDMWKKFDLPTPPLSPSHDFEDDLELENVIMPFDIDTEDLLLFEDEYNEVLKEVASTFPESPPGINPDTETCINPDTETCLNLQSNLIQDIMWSAPAKVDNSSTKVTPSEKQRLRCNSCSNPFNTACVAPDEVLMETNIGGSMSQTKVHNLGIETPSDSEEEIDVVTVEKQFHVSVPTLKRKYKSEEESNTEQYRSGNKTVTLTIEHKPGNVQTITKCTSVRQRVDCPTDVHNYSLPVTSLKRVHSYPSSPVTHKSKRIRRDISIPSDLKKVAQKLKSSVGICSRSSSDSEDVCDVGKRTQHNVLERKRRTDLKNSFFHLRDSVPELEGQERAPKVVILRKASQYIHRLIDEHRQKERDYDHLRAKNEKLKRHIARLRDY